MDTTADAYLYAEVRMMGNKEDEPKPFNRSETETENLRRARSAYPRHFELAEALLTLASEALVEFGARGHPGPMRANSAQFATQLLFMKAYKSFWSIVLLCERRLADDAAVVLRALLNLWIVARWVRQDPRRARWYREWFWIAASRFVSGGTRLKEHPDLRDAFAEAEDYFHREGPTPGGIPREWHGSNIGDMAHAVGLKSQYEVVYRTLSSIEHSDMMSYLAIISSSGPGLSIQLWADRMIGEYLGLAFSFFTLMLREWNDMFQVVAPERIQRIADQGVELLLPEFRPKGPEPGETRT